MRYSPVSPADLPDTIAARVPGGRARVAVDGALATGPHELAAAVVELLRSRGRPARHVRAETFWRDASLRLEHGHTDLLSYSRDWLDVAAVRRELLDPLGPDGSGRYLASLRDPVTNRATREPASSAEPDLVVVVSGELLLGHGLGFELTVHLAASAAALQRRTPPDRAWTLPAFASYDADVDPGEGADLVVKVDDPKHPAVRVDSA